MVRLDRAVVVEIGGGAGGAGAVYPESGGDSPAPPLALYGLGVVVVILGGLGGLNRADARVYDAGGAAGAFLSAVEDAEVYRIHAQSLAELVNDRLGGEGADGRARRAVGGGLGLVVHHVVGVYDDVGDVVWREDAVCRRAYGGAGERARLESQIGVGGGHAPVVGNAHLHLHPRAGRGAAGFHDLYAVHGYLDGGAGLLGQRDGERLQIDGGLAAESAAYLHGDYLDGRERHADDGCREVAYLEVPLRTAPDGDAVLRRPPAGGGVWLYVSLMDGLGSELALDGDFGLLEPRVNVADFKPRVAGDVVGEFGMEQRRAVGHRVLYGGDGGQDFVLYVNEV